MNEQDKRAVEGMANCGISLEDLKKTFPKFPASEVEAIYNKVKKIRLNIADIGVKTNCS